MSLSDAILIKSFNCASLETSLVKNLFVASQVNQLKIFRDFNNLPIGYVCFAMLDNYTLNYIMKENGEIQFPYEWNEGSNLFIVDYSYLKEVRSYFFESLEEFFIDKEFIYYKVKNVSKVSTKNRIKRISNIDLILRRANAS